MFSIQFTGEFGGLVVRGWTTLSTNGVAHDDYETEAAAEAAIEGPGGLAEEALLTSGVERALVKSESLSIPEWSLVDSDGEPVRNGYRLRIVQG